MRPTDFKMRVQSNLVNDFYSGKAFLLHEMMKRGKKIRKK